MKTYGLILFSALLIAALVMHCHHRIEEKGEIDSFRFDGELKRLADAIG